MSHLAPLSERLRPKNVDEIVGHESIVGTDGAIRHAIRCQSLRSFILWGPPGVGKTTFARAIADEADMLFITLSAVFDGVKSLRGVFERAELERNTSARGTLLFVDEIHRWNKAQQDALLPHLEKGNVVLVGATTENPNFELNAALRSRAQIIRLEPLTQENVRELLTRALQSDDTLANASVSDEFLDAIARTSAGDARRALDDLERCVIAAGDQELTPELAANILKREDIRHDRAGSDHYDCVSAWIKSMRGSDPDAAIYWLARLITGGENPRFLARRLIIFASEDVGNADPRALQVATDAARAVDWVGMPEGRIPLAQATTWLASAPKSNESYKAINKALAEVRNSGALPVPRHLRQSDGEGYRYPHDYPHRIVKQAHLPDALKDQTFYHPNGPGEEKTLRERLLWWREKIDTSK